MLKQAEGIRLPTKAIADIASTLSLGLLSPTSSHPDPMKLGEVGWAVAIAEEYERRLCRKRDLPSSLIVGYRSHSFVIDIEEAQQMFGEEIVRPLNDLERELERMLMSDVRHEKESLVIDLIKAYVPDLLVPQEGQELEQGEEQEDEL